MKPVLASSLPPNRTLPCNIELEQALLGAILVNNDAFHRVSDFVEPRHFFDQFHQKLFEIAASLIRVGKTATPITLKTFLSGDTDIGGLTVSQYLARLAAEATSVINAADYGQEIYELASRRALINIGEEICSASYDSTPVSRARLIASGAIEALDGVVTSHVDAHLARVHIGDAATEAMRRLSDAMQNPGKLCGLSWGLKTIDERTGGLCDADLIIVAARPSMGKTGLMLSTALRVTKSGHPVLFFSLEMTAAPLSDRAITDIAYDRRQPIPYFDMKRGIISVSDYDRLEDAARHLRELPLMIEQQPALSIAQISARARKYQQFLERKRQKLGLLVVDHIHIVRPSAEYRGRRVDELTAISADLRALAKELNVPVVALAQLSRQVEGRDDKRPQLSDLRDSGSIEQDADLVVFLYREEYYLERKLHDGLSQHEKHRVQARLFEVKDHLEFIIAKQRNGATGAWTIFFDAACNHIDDLESTPR
jgi:replicative DNA helicase